MTDKPEDDLTVAYMYGYEKGKDKYQAENKRLREALELIENNCPCSKTKKVAEQALKGELK